MATDRLTPYQRYVVLCAWVGIGFDLMDSILFNFVAPIAIPNLLGLAAGSPAARTETAFYSGLLTSVMLLGWALGGIGFGRVSDLFGRARTVVFTMLLFSLGTGACALAPNLAALIVFRFITAVGIGGEWAAGATLVAESVPESRRVQMGTVLFTAPPFFVFLAIGVSRLFTLELESVASNPSLSWRLVMGFGALPALAALVIRRGLREPEAWRPGTRDGVGLARLFTPELRARTVGGLVVATTALITFWVVSAFLPVVAQRLAGTGPTARALSARYVTAAMAWFNLGGLVGSLAAGPLALRVGRRAMFALYFTWSALAVALAFGLPLSTEQRLVAFGLVGVSVYGVFGAFQFYLPELFPAHLRGTGAGFCLNAGRVLTVAGPFAVGAIVRGGISPLEALRDLAVVPVLGLVAVLAGAAVETRGERLGAG
jgi:MFS family permease